MRTTARKNGAQWRGICALFSRQDESADAVIKQLSIRGGEKIVAITPDRDVALSAIESRTGTTDAVQFDNRMA